MSRPNLESFLAKLYTDEEALRRFVCAPYAEAERAGLSPEECSELSRMDMLGLQFAARSFSKKRERRRA